MSRARVNYRRIRMALVGLRRVQRKFEAIKARAQGPVKRLPACPPACLPLQRGDAGRAQLAGAWRAMRGVALGPPPVL